MKLRTKALLGTALLTLALLPVTLLPFAPPARAATLTEVTNFGTNPSNLRMHLYVPDRVAARPAILVAVHFCTGTGPDFFNGMGREFATLADQLGYIVIFPSATRSGQCFDVYTSQALRHDGGSDPVGIVSMVRFVQQRFNADPNRVFVTGASSGGMMTNVLLGAYPDVFRAGAAFMGVPFACFATTPPNTWNSECANGQVIRTPQQWGDLVRGAFPGYTGPRPRMQVWHGTEDTTLRYPNFGEQVKQWTNVHGLGQTPTVTDSPRAGWTRTRYGGSGTGVAVEGVSIAGVGHSIPTSGMAQFAIQFFGLNTTPPPTTPAPGPGGCRVTYAVNPWNTGLTTAISITNTGTASISGWGLAFTLPSGQTITGSWNATYSPPSGAVTLRNVGHNGLIGPGATVRDIGFQATHTGNTGRPPSFSLNGRECTNG